ncbi:MAG TPA: MFS transporter [Thermoleophilaceae bacterium]|jgi:EmrB/QacA subfamily drug resistance transporter
MASLTENNSITRKVTLAVVSLATAMLMLDIAVVNTALSSISKDLHTGLNGLQWVIDAYTLALATVVLSAGSLADRLGRRKVFVVGLVVFTVSSLVCALSGSIVMLDVARAVQGLGAAAMFAVSLALLAHAYPGMRERAGALAVYGATIGASFAVGPLIGGLLTSGLGWRWIFLVNIPFGIIAIAATLKRVEESRDPLARSIDWIGQIVLGGGLFLLVFALLRGNDQGWGSTAIIAELSGAAVLLALFAYVEQRVKEPMLPLKFFRNRGFAATQAGTVAISASFFAAFIYTTLYLQNVLGLSAIQTGLVYMPGTVIMFFVSGASAQLGEKVSPRLMVSGGLALVAAGMLLMTLAGVGSSWTIILPGEVIALIGTGLFNPAMSGVAMGSLPQRHSGLAAGAYDTFRQAGMAVGIAALGALIPASSALGHGNQQDYVDGMRLALVVGAFVAALGALATARLLRGRKAIAADAQVVYEGA